MKNVVVLATYNEADNIAILLGQLKEYQVVVVDDNSKDGTAKIARQFKNVEVIVRTEEKGIASAYIRGFNEAFKYNPEYVIQMDAGLTHDPMDVERLIYAAKKWQCPLIIGSRFQFQPEIKSYRTLISLAARFLMNFIHVNVSDATSGFRCWDVNLLKSVLKSQVLSKGFAFQLELLHEANRLSEGNVETISINYKLTNSSFRFGMLLEALKIYSILLFR
jgi:dolichol-phosphate mannosyltransferase